MKNPKNIRDIINLGIREALDCPGTISIEGIIWNAQGVIHNLDKSERVKNNFQKELTKIEKIISYDFD